MTTFVPPAIHPGDSVHRYQVRYTLTAFMTAPDIRKSILRMQKSGITYIYYSTVLDSWMDILHDMEPRMRRDYMTPELEECAHKLLAGLYP